jgi:hypothetical protein
MTQVSCCGSVFHRFLVCRLQMGTSRPPPSRPSNNNSYWLSTSGKRTPSFQAVEPPSFVSVGTSSFVPPPGTDSGHHKVPSRGQRLAAKVSGSCLDVEVDEDHIHPLMEITSIRLAYHDGVHAHTLFCCFPDSS